MSDGYVQNVNKVQQKYTQRLPEILIFVKVFESDPKYQKNQMFYSNLIFENTFVQPQDITYY